MMPKSNDNLDRQDVLYHNLSQLLHANAIIPPQTHENIKLFDIVLIQPDNCKSQMIQPTDLNLCKILTSGECENLRSNIEQVDYDKEAHLSSLHVWSLEIRNMIQNGIKSIDGKFNINSDRFVDLAIGERTNTSIRYNICGTLEDYVHENFAKLVTDKSFSSLVQKRFLIGIITGKITGKIDSILERNVDVTTAAKLNMTPVNGSATGDVTVKYRESLYSNGIIGVNMVCFLIETNSKTHEYRISKAIHVVQGNEKQLDKALQYIRPGIRNNVMIKIRKLSRHVFAAGYTISDDDPSLTDEERKEFVKITEERGKILGSDQVEDQMVVMRSFCGKTGEDLLNMSEPFATENPDTTPVLIVDSLEGLQEIKVDEGFPWMKKMQPDIDNPK